MDAERIVIASVVDVDTVDGVATRVTLRVQEVLRGVSGPEVVLEPPMYAVCGDHMSEPIGTRLLVATGSHFFGGGKPLELHPYWKLLPGDVVEPAGVDDPDPDHTRLAGLLAEFGGLPVPTVEPGEVIVEPSALGPGVLAAVAIVVATMLAVAALFVAVVIVARRGRPLR